MRQRSSRKAGDARRQRRVFYERLEARYALDGAALGEGEAGDMLGDFQLTDVNPSSDQFGESVSPRDYLNEVTAWYFTHST